MLMDGLFWVQYHSKTDMLRKGCKMKNCDVGQQSIGTNIDFNFKLSHCSTAFGNISVTFMTNYIEQE